jgi:hypothetical protein
MLGISAFSAINCPHGHLLCTESPVEQFTLTPNLKTLASSILATVCADVGPPRYPLSRLNPARQLPLSRCQLPLSRCVAPSSMESNRGSSSGGKRHHLGPAPKELATALSHLSVGAPQPPRESSFGWSPAAATSLGLLGLQEWLLG